MVVSFMFRMLPALLLSAAPAQSTPMMSLCDPEIVSETCKIMDPTDATHVDVVKVSSALSATRKATMRFWKALKFQKVAQHEPCEAFCEKLINLLKKCNVHLPEYHDKGCYEDTHGKTHCDMDLAPEDITDFVDHTEHDLHDYHAEEVEIENPPEEEAPEGEDQNMMLDYTIDEMACRVANIFRIYPELKVHITERVTQVSTDGKGPASSRYSTSFGGGYGYGGGSSYGGGVKHFTPTWKVTLQQVNQKAQAYVSYAIRQMMQRAATKHLSAWFGRSLSMRDTNEVKRVLNSIDKMLGNVEYVYPGPKCKPRTYAYVYPRAYTCALSEIADRPCMKTNSGKFVFYMCQLTMNSRLPEQIETLTHEGSHHAVAYTDDVTVPWGTQTAYGRQTCKQLARQSTSLSIKNADNYCYFIQDVTDQR